MSLAGFVVCIVDIGITVSGFRTQLCLCKDRISMTGFIRVHPTSSLQKPDSCKLISLPSNFHIAHFTSGIPFPWTTLQNAVFLTQQWYGCKWGTNE